MHKNDERNHIYMKFAHLADCHIGGWRDPKLSVLSVEALSKVVDICIEKSVDFMLISGDLFNTSVPSIDMIKATVKQLMRLKDKNIPIYLIAGSHDYSPSGKTMLDVLENTNLFINVTKRSEIINGKIKLNFVIDPKTGAKITGMLGKRGGLETTYYEHLMRDHLEQEEGYKIFMFHSAIAELKPKELEKMDAGPISYLPKGFDYYAGGHVHIVKHANLDEYKNVVYPGPLFPNSFGELEKLKHGGFYLVEDGNATFVPLILYPAMPFSFDCEGKSSRIIQQEILECISEKDMKDHIVLLRLEGQLSEGRPSDIDFRQIFEKIYGKQAYFVMKNTYKLTSKEFEVIQTNQKSAEDIEDHIISEHAGQFFDKEEEISLTKDMMQNLAVEKQEGERVVDYEERIIEHMQQIIEK